MFNFLKKISSSRGVSKRRGDPPPVTESVVLHLSGLHCTSCAVNIDLTLEDLPGVTKATTNYAKSESAISYDPAKTSPKTIKLAIEELGYKVII